VSEHRGSKVGVKREGIGSSVSSKRIVFKQSQATCLCLLFRSQGLYVTVHHCPMAISQFCQSKGSRCPTMHWLHSIILQVTEVIVGDHPIRASLFPQGVKHRRVIMASPATCIGTTQCHPLSQLVHSVVISREEAHQRVPLCP
jgi:hypothetical protein